MVLRAIGSYFHSLQGTTETVLPVDVAQRAGRKKDRPLKLLAALAKAEPDTEFYHVEDTRFVSGLLDIEKKHPQVHFLPSFVDPTLD